MSARMPGAFGRALASILALLLTVVGVPVVLIAISTARFGSGLPLAGVQAPWSWSFGDVESGLREPFDDQTVIELVLRLALVIGWIGVALLLATVAGEFIHQVRHRGIPTPHVRGLGWAQGTARWIVAGLIVLPTFTQGTVPLSALEPTDLTPATEGSHVFDLGSVQTFSPARGLPGDVESVPTGARPSGHARADGTAPTPVHQVRPGESVYEIAAQLAGGDPDRTFDLAHEILDSNLGHTMADGQRFTNPAYIEVGWTLRLPSSAPTRPAAPRAAPSLSDAHLVVKGDTLSSIARTKLGRDDAWVEIWEANAHRTMPDGRVFDDPNVIVPGWLLRLPASPAADPADSAAEEKNEGADTNHDTPRRGQPSRATPDLEASPHGTGSDAETGADTVSATTVPDRVEEVAPERPQSAPPPPTRINPAAAAGAGGDVADSDPSGALNGNEEIAERLDGTVGLERAALLSAGVVSLAALLRGRRLRSARAGARVPEPTPSHVALARRMRHDPAAERLIRMEAAIRAVAAHCLSFSDEPVSDRAVLARVAVVRLSPRGDVAIRLSGDVDLPAPWGGSGNEWCLPFGVPIDEIASDARRVGDPCHALAPLGVTPEGDDILIDLEAAGTLVVGGEPGSADDILRAIAAGLSVAEHAEACQLIGDEAAAADALGHPNAYVVDGIDSAIELATELAGSTRSQPSTSFELRARRTGADIWEPAVVLLSSETVAAGSSELDDRWPGDAADLFEPAHGIALVTPSPPPGVDHAWTLEPAAGEWRLTTAFGIFRVTPVGVTESEARQLESFVEAADSVPEVEDLAWADEIASSSATGPEFTEAAHDIVVRLLAGGAVVDRADNAASFSRSKAAELIAWLVTHRDRSTRTAARTALWDMDVRDATFANVVSEARRTLARLAEPPKGEWLARTLTEDLPLDPGVTSDADLIRARLDHARAIVDDRSAIEVLQPVIDLVSDAPFAGTDYLWPDAEGITSNLVLLAVGACTELATRALRVGDIELLFAATDRGLRVLPGHEEMIALRMRAHAQSGDTAGVRQEWKSYERAILADPWSDGEPAPRLRAVRAELLGQPA